MKNRKLYNTLYAEKDNSSISLIIGARQVGKTSLLKMLQENIGNNACSVYIDLDILSNFERVSTYESCLNTLKLNGYKEGSAERFYFFLDEFQRYADLTRILKNMIDHHPNIKIYATGSSSLAIKEKASESLAGRKRIHHLYPLDFEEYLWFTDKPELASGYAQLSEMKGNAVIPGFIHVLEEFLIWGGYPGVALTDSPVEKKLRLNDIFDLFAHKDLAEYLSLRNLPAAKKVIEFLAVNHGQRVKTDEISRVCGIRNYEVSHLLDVYRETFLIHELRPYFTNKNSELVKNPKLYFTDNGVRNYFINNFNPLPKRNDTGFLFEAFVTGELIKAGIPNLKFWRNKNDQEVDIILENGSTLIALEIKYSSIPSHDDLRGLKALAKSYATDLEKSYLINTGFQGKRDIAECLLPFHLAGRLAGDHL